MARWLVRGGGSDWRLMRQPSQTSTHRRFQWLQVFKLEHCGAVRAMGASAGRPGRGWRSGNRPPPGLTKIPRRTMAKRKSIASKVSHAALFLWQGRPHPTARNRRRARPACRHHASRLDRGPWISRPSREVYQGLKRTALGDPAADPARLMICHRV
jgi:hypothetical protein